jgi:hypothetical protein
MPKSCLRCALGMLYFALRPPSTGGADSAR